MTTPRYIPPRGPDNATYMLVGEAPGAKEEQMGQPFIGPSGKLLSYCLQRVGIRESDVYITNVCKYRPPNNKIEKFCRRSKKLGRVPNDLVKHGLYELYSDIARVKPKVIIPVGNVALWALFGQENIAKRRGSVLPVELSPSRIDHVAPFFSSTDEMAATLGAMLGHKLVPTFHPANVGREYTLKPIFEKDLKKARRETGYPEIRWPQRTIHIDPPQDLAYQLASHIADHPRFAFDIETPGGELYCCGFSCDPSWGMVVRTDEQWKFDLIRMLLESEREKIAHNGLFDTGFLLYHYGIDVRHYAYDTMYEHKLVYADFRQGLDFIASFLTDEPYYKDEGKDQDLSIAASAEEYMQYCGKDACVTMEAMLELEARELKKPCHLRSVQSRRALLPIARHMMVRGIRVDMELFNRMRREKIEELGKLQTDLDEVVMLQLIDLIERSKDASKKQLAHALATAMRQRMELGEPGLNVNSVPDMKVYLYELRGFKKKKHKKTHKDTTAEDALKELYGETGDVVLLQIVKIRKVRKLLSNYLSYRAVPGGRLVYSVNIARTKTQRWSSGQTIIILAPSKKRRRKAKTGANAQTVPLEVRMALIADPGMILFYADYAQIEDRIVAYAGGVKKKIHAFENGIDAHALSAAGFFDTTIEAVLEEAKRMKAEGKTPPMRYIGKQSNHAYNYEEGWRTWMRNLNKKYDETGVRVTAAQSKAVRASHFRMYPEIEHVYWAWIQEQLRQRGRLVNCFGYERTFYGLRNWPARDRAVYRDAYSWYPQSVPPECVNRSMVRIRKELPEVEMLLHMHDGIFGQVPEAMVDELREPIVQLMDEPLQIRDTEIHIPVDIKFGERWGPLG